MFSFKELPDEEKPRERLILYGVDKLSNEELLMILLKTGTKKYSVKELANKVLLKSNGIQNLKDITLTQLMTIEGIGQIKAIELIALVEIAKRIYAPITNKELVYFTNPQTIKEYFNSLYQGKKQEEFYVVYLDNKKKYIEKKKLFVGSVNSSIAHPREIFKYAYLLSASFLICIHNHPSGDPTPSKEDLVITKNLYELGKLHAIGLIDHIIIGRDCYYSFYENKNILNNN